MNNKKTIFLSLVGLVALPNVNAMNSRISEVFGKNRNNQQTGQNQQTAQNRQKISNNYQPSGSLFNDAKLKTLEKAKFNKQAQQEKDQEDKLLVAKWNSSLNKALKESESIIIDKETKNIMDRSDKIYSVIKNERIRNNGEREAIREKIAEIYDKKVDILRMFSDAPEGVEADRFYAAQEAVVNLELAASKLHMSLVLADKSRHFLADVEQDANPLYRKLIDHPHLDIILKDVIGNKSTRKSQLKKILDAKRKALEAGLSSEEEKEEEKESEQQTQ